MTLRTTQCFYINRFLPTAGGPRPPGRWTPSTCGGQVAGNVKTLQNMQEIKRTRNFRYFLISCIFCNVFTLADTCPPQVAPVGGPPPTCGGHVAGNVKTLPNMQAIKMPRFSGAF